MRTVLNLIKELLGGLVELEYICQPLDTGLAETVRTKIHCLEGT